MGLWRRGQRKAPRLSRFLVQLLLFAFLLTNMLKLPHAIVVQVEGSRAPISKLLIAVHFLHRAEYYFGGVVGLTDANGEVVFLREAIEQAFAANQRLFPMDYRIPLVDCDSMVRVVILGGEEFLAAQKTALASPLTAATAKDLWREADNSPIRSLRESVDLNKADPDRVVIKVTASPR
jgi:hypothetical protein